jgi:hypothetical protein
MELEYLGKREITHDLPETVEPAVLSEYAPAD